MTDVFDDGLKQLEMVNSMERQHDNNLWASAGMFAAANGVFLVALFAAFGKLAKPAELQMGFGFLGLVVNLSWVITAVRADTYCIMWINKAKEIQKGIQVGITMWDKNRPPGIRSWWATVVLMATFLIVWSYSAWNGATQLEGWYVGASLVALMASWIVFAYAIIRKWVYERSFTRPSTA